MLTQEDNELITRVGPGTPMGELMRQYWIPVMLTSDLGEPDGRPQRVRLLGENLILFRDTRGRAGLLADNCSHRGASLFFGRNEENGLRCVYHGWKYGVDGQCMDMPNEPPESNFKDKIRQRAYPCRERGGMIWTYMGPRSQPPPLPDLEWALLPEEQRVFQWQAVRECNWLQALEGDIDTSHLSWLHSRLDAGGDPSAGTYHNDRAPRLEIAESEIGLLYAARRAEDESSYLWRITQWVLPFYGLFPGRGDEVVPMHIWVPIDDYNTMAWGVRWNPVRPFSERERAAESDIRAGIGELLPPTTAPWGRWRSKGNRGNDYLLDPEAQRTQNFTGIPSVPMQDTAVTESMGPILDRSNEHLGTSDAMVIQVRRRLIALVTALREQGVTPPGVDDASLFRVRSGAVTLPRDLNWLETMRDWLSARGGMPVAASGSRGI